GSRLVGPTPGDLSAWRAGRERFASGALTDGILARTMNGAPERTDLLIVAAHAPEMAGLRPWLSDSLIGQIRGLTVRGKAVGIGMAIAGPATARGILAVSPRAVLLVGSCGVYPNLPQYRPHDVIVARRVQLVS